MYDREKYLKYKQKRIISSANWKRNNPDKVKIIAKRYRDSHKEQSNEWRKYHNELYPDRIRESSKKAREKLRNSVFDIIGRKCIKCGFPDIRALQFDHINGDGYIDNKHRTGRTFKYYRDNPEITKKVLQPLCANCNQIKRHLNGENWRHHKQ